MKYDALTAARRLAASGLAWCWLDGESAGAGEPRVSYLGLASDVFTAETGRETEFLDEFHANRSKPDGEFRSGWVTALSYELGVALLGLEPVRDSVAPGFALRLDAVLAIDHTTGRARITGDEAAGRMLREVLDTEVLDTEVPDAETLDVPLAAEMRAAEAELQPRWRSDDDAYLRQVEECREAIHRGDAYVLCLTDTAEIDLPRLDALTLYERLRGGGAARRGAVIAVPGRALVSASPERFLTVRGDTVSTHPIKGTRPRGATPELDLELGAELAADAKERAENLMIVDLMRNDLSRVCEPGTVRVERFLAVERHTHVHQLVSSVTGCLRHGLSVRDTLLAAFPGGSMTGAPKLSSVQILQRLERGPRGLYSGCFGWIDDSGDAELAMTIRGVELREQADGSTQALVGAGGGITADSHAARELAEKSLKASAVFAALRAE